MVSVKICENFSRKSIKLVMFVSIVYSQILESSLCWKQPWRLFFEIAGVWNLETGLNYTQIHSASCSTSVDFQIPNYSAPHSHHFTDGQLVRIQGMVQDMHNPEYYISKYIVHNKTTGAKEERSGKYKDIMKVEVNFNQL